MIAEFVLETRRLIPGLMTPKESVSWRAPSGKRMTFFPSLSSLTRVLNTATSLASPLTGWVFSARMRAPNPKTLNSDSRAKNWTSCGQETATRGGSKKEVWLGAMIAALEVKFSKP